VLESHIGSARTRIPDRGKSGLSALRGIPLPTFFVVGASKCGTTALHRYLDLHPEIEMSDPKEPHLMLGPVPEERAIAYRELFGGRTPLRGECSTGYSVFPHQPEVAPNIARLVPQARIVYLVRDPVERTIAHYAQAFTVGRETRGIEEAIDPYDDDNYFVTASRYWRQVERYLRCFDRSAILVIDSQALRQERERVMAMVYEHVQADPAFRSDEFKHEHHTRGVDNVTVPPLARRLRSSALADVYRWLVPLRVRRFLSPRMPRYLGGREVRPEPSERMLDELAEVLAPDAERLREFTGAPYESWSV
jgi:hypothetical protein